MRRKQAVISRTKARAIKARHRNSILTGLVTGKNKASRGTKLVYEHERSERPIVRKDTVNGRSVVQGSNNPSIGNALSEALRRQSATDSQCQQWC